MPSSSARGGRLKSHSTSSAEIWSRNRPYVSRTSGRSSGGSSSQRSPLPLILNPFDARAVAEAVRLREVVGGEVIAMTMGPPQAEEALRECLALGADRCIHLSDRVFALADTIGTSRTLAMAIEKEGCELV